MSFFPAKFPWRKIGRIYEAARYEKWQTTNGAAINNIGGKVVWGIHVLLADRASPPRQRQHCRAMESQVAESGSLRNTA